MYLLLPTANQSGFSVAGFLDLSEMSMSVQVALAIGERQAGCKLPHNCTYIVMLSVDLATFGAMFHLI